MKKAIPTWIIIISGLITLLGFFVGISLYFAPGTFIPNVNFSAAEIKYLVNMWAARQIAVSAIIGYSLIKMSAEMLKISLMAYCLMNLQDVVIGIMKADNGLIIGASLFCLLSAYMIFSLKNKKQIK